MQQQSNYPNPLDNFRSYSYHFILTAADTTEDFQKMIGSGSDPLYSKIEDIKLGDKVPGTDNAYLVIDTRRFSQFMITEFEAEHMYGLGDSINPSMPINSYSMKIVDTTGLTFFNFLMDLFRKKLKSTRMSSFFLLNIIYVGHGDGNEVDTVISTTYIPLILLMMGFEFNSSGSIYDAEFFELIGGPGRGSKAAHINYLSNVGYVTTKPNDNTIGAMIRTLEESLNKRSIEFYKNYTNNFKSISGKLVQYMINIPPEWEKYEITAAARSKLNEQKFLTKNRNTSKTEDLQKAEYTKNGESMGDTISQTAFAPNTTITDAITKILETSEQVLKNAETTKAKSGKAEVFKIAINITSDKTTYLVHFDVMPYFAPKIDNETGSISAISSHSGWSPGPKSKNLIYYDYIFTGRNSHITDLKIVYAPEAAVAFDMNIELGGARNHKVAALGGQNRQSIDSLSKTKRSANDMSTILRDADPIFPSMKTTDNAGEYSLHAREDQMYEQNIDLLKSRQEYRGTMATLHFLSSIELNMTIRGNPNLLVKYADLNYNGGIAPHSSGKIMSEENIQKYKSLDVNTRDNNIYSSINSGLESARQLYRSKYYLPKISPKPTNSEDTLNNGISVFSMPVFVKLNILAPNVDLEGEFVSAQEMYSDKLFYNGPYLVLSIKHTFQGGEFFQTMTLIPYDIDGSFIDGESQVKTVGT